MGLAERLGIGWRHLPHVMTERDQLAGYIVRAHTGFDADQARRDTGKHTLHLIGLDEAASKLLSQNDHSLRGDRRRLDERIEQVTEEIEVLARESESCRHAHRECDGRGHELPLPRDATLPPGSAWCRSVCPQAIGRSVGRIRKRGNRVSHGPNLCFAQFAA